MRGLLGHLLGWLFAFPGIVILKVRRRSRRSPWVGIALLAHHPAAGMGQADTERPALRTARHGSPAIKNPS